MMKEEKALALAPAFHEGDSAPRPKKPNKTNEGESVPKLRNQRTTTRSLGNDRGNEEENNIMAPERFILEGPGAFNIKPGGVVHPAGHDISEDMVDIHLESSRDEKTFSIPNATIVEEEEDIENLRKIVNGAVNAEIVKSDKEKKGKRKFCIMKRIGTILCLVALMLGITIGLAVAITNEVQPPEQSFFPTSQPSHLTPSRGAPGEPGPCSECLVLRACAGNEEFCNSGGIQGDGNYFCSGGGDDHGEKCFGPKNCNTCEIRSTCSGNGGYCATLGEIGYGTFKCQFGIDDGEKCEYSKLDWQLPSAQPSLTPSMNPTEPERLPEELLGKSVYLVNFETLRLLFADGEQPTVSEGENEGGWLKSPAMKCTDSNYYNRAQFIITEKRNGLYEIRNEITNRLVFCQGEQLTEGSVSEGGWLAASGYEAPDALGADVNYYGRALWRIDVKFGNNVIFKNNLTGRLLFSDGDTLVNKRGSEGGWKEASGFEAPNAVTADANYYNRAFWTVTTELPDDDV